MIFNLTICKKSEYHINSNNVVSNEHSLHFQVRNSIYNQYTMKAKHIFNVVILLLVILTFVLVLTNFNPPAAFAKDAATTALQQSTPTPPAVDSSEIGSTDGILIMGIVIVLIVTLPLILQKRK
jgi:uncharacterized integral membrane protein